MDTASHRFLPGNAWLRLVPLLFAWCLVTSPAGAAGTTVGTVIDNTAVVDFDLAGTPLTVQSNTTTITVAERINVTVTPQSPQVLVTPGDAGRALLFTVTNTGNGTEVFRLAMDSVIAGNDFNPTPATSSIYFDTDNSGDFNAGDQPYTPGDNDPELLADESINVFVVNDIPLTATNGQTGRSQLTATSATGTGAPGTVFPNQGDGGVNAVIGLTQGEASDTGEYLVSDVQVAISKAQLVSDPFGGSEPIPGATLTYTITVDVTSPGTASASVVRDAIPALTTFVSDSITLNGNDISDAIDGDAGEYDTSGTASVVVRLGDLQQGDPVQTVVFQVTID